MRIDLNLFIVFDAIYTEGNLTRAANVLNLTQPAVSHSLARLRDHFDDPLFVRQSNKMLPTAVAKNVISDVREALHQLQVALQQSRQFDPSSAQKRYAISLHDSLETSYLPYLMDHINREAPLIDLTSTRVRRSELENKLASGDIDFAIDILLPVSDNICHTQLENDQLVVVAAKDHPDIIDHLDIANYLEQKHVLVSSRVSGPGMEDFELGRLGLQRRVGLRCQHFFSACRVVESSDMLLTIPQTAAKMFSKVLNISTYPLPVELPGIDVHLYWHINVDKDPANRWLRNKILMASSNH
ncbi:LysR family transcriptional regulator [Alkalimarinus sediminis]|uniref:LysR family transcriptional regulator n=1 Tax=Alkalimarinus sediminis TaxID=1632866 RepID=A0A9E8KPQ4_9ALTE|nr:LysR family transcriptional regulator [Alkalimarinus sediminis]UZW75578.1 LysR family transcriptional regulator [Alkalimarinus sediminis]